MTNVVEAQQNEQSAMNEAWRERWEAVMTPQYGRRRLALVRGEGTRVWDADGREYLDFLTGISVNNLGHCHPRITEAIRQQAGEIVHTTNIYYIPKQIELAGLLVGHSFADRAFFCNSGAEANEAAIKIARRFMAMTRGEGHHEIIGFTGAFHGRTIATLSAAGAGKYTEGYEPLLPGFKRATFNDLESVRALVTEATGAIIVEPVQGEGGIHPAEESFMRGLRALCDERGLLLICDEVQSGLGRGGALFAYETYGIEPDIMTLAKSLGGGLAMGAMLCREPVAEAFGVGMHGTTMGGNHLTSAAALAYVSELIEGEWPRRAAETGARMAARLREELAGLDNFVEVRQRGLMLAVALKEKARDVLAACETEGLLVNVTGGENIRLLPPLNIGAEDADRGLEILVRCIREA